MKFAPLTILLLLSLGCGDKTKSQIFAVNKMIDTHNPKNDRLGKSSDTNSNEEVGFFDFVKGKGLEEFPEIAQLAEPLTIEHPAFKDYRMEEWGKQFPEGTTYKFVFCNIWELDDGSEPTDFLVFAIQDGKVADWRMFSLYPY